MSQLVLDPNAFPGGIAIWGGVPPIVCTTPHYVNELGIHVHARKRRGAEKDIDQSFDSVVFLGPDSNAPVSIDETAAVGFMIAQVLGVQMVDLECIECGHLIFEGRGAACYPKTTHRCQNCEAESYTRSPVVANPLIRLRKRYSSNVDPPVIRVNRKFDKVPKDFPGGLQIWGSNQAIVWTAQRSEEEGLHIHWYDENGGIIDDDTYGSVCISGKDLDVTAARLWMAQKEVPELLPHVGRVNCSRCGAPICSKDVAARRPSVSHLCSICRHTTYTEQAILANPIPSILRELDLLQ